MQTSAQLLDSRRVHAGAMADAAAGVTCRYFRTAFDISNKSGDGFDPVTIADEGAEDAMRAYLAQHCPDDGILGEERGDVASRSGFTWVLDPIDGTRSFVTGLPVWTTLIGLVDGDMTPILGVIDQPFLGERYVGWNTGACIETKAGVTPLKTNQTLTIDDAMVATTDAFLFDSAELAQWTQVQAQAKISRYGLDGYAYAILARGGLDLVMEAGLARHDMAALFPVIRGAGGVVTDWAGKHATLESGQILAVANDKLLSDVLGKL